MDKLFKRTKKKNDKRSDIDNSDNGSSNNSIKIDEEVDIPPSKKSANLSVRPTLNDDLRHTWPRLPEIALTTSQGSRPLDTPDSPSLSNSSSQAFLGHNNITPPLNNVHNGYTGQASAYNSNENTSSDSESGTEVNIGAADPRGETRETLYDDDGRSFTSLSKLASLNNDHHKTGFELDDSAAATLVEAALDKDEAQDRHVRFQDHVAESAVLVQRMLSVKMGRHHREPDPLSTAIQNRRDSRNNKEEFELESLHSMGGGGGGGGGSVLASLMKLEASRHEGEVKKSKKRSKVS
jgi:hypothetical protein